MYCHYNPEYRYSMMERAAERWHATGLWEEICRLKAIIVEERKPESFAETIAAYYDSVACGALLLAVCRGKVSEGLDFKGEKARDRSEPCIVCGASQRQTNARIYCESQSSVVPI